jgi:hypothetical protein
MPATAAAVVDRLSPADEYSPLRREQRLGYRRKHDRT